VIEPPPLPGRAGPLRPIRDPEAPAVVGDGVETVSKVPRKFRRRITPEEFLETCARFYVDCRMAGSKMWFYDQYTTRTREGSPVAPQYVVERVATDRFEGEPKLEFFLDTRNEGQVDVQFTAAGKRWRRGRTAWSRAVQAGVAIPAEADAGRRGRAEPA